jgi:release factor glutamine methyltransferase
VTVGEWLVSAQARLAESGVGSPRLEAQLLAAHVFLVERVWVLAHPSTTIPEQAAEGLLARRLSGEPLAYILGWREFFGRRFSVGRGVLIPRQETEILVETCLRLGPAGPARVLDVGTGSGILAVTLSLERPEWDVWAVDLSPGALEMAAQNSEDLAASVRFIESDLFGANSLPADFDLIVSNPPYVGLEDPLPVEVREFEPEEALFAGSDGLAVYRRLALEAQGRLRRDGLMLLEVGDGMAAEVAELFQEAGWRVREAVNDLALMPRVLALQSQV